MPNEDRRGPGRKAVHFSNEMVTIAEILFPNNGYELGFQILETINSNDETRIMYPNQRGLGLLEILRTLNEGAWVENNPFTQDEVTDSIHKLMKHGYISLVKDTFDDYVLTETGTRLAKKDERAMRLFLGIRIKN